MRLRLIFTLLCVSATLATKLRAEEINLRVTQITHGPHHHFFGYIGQCLTTPWNASGRYIVSLRTSFHDRMPKPGEAADVVLIDTQNDFAVTLVEKCRAWNFQQGTMFYWNPAQPETQFFFNDREPDSNRVFTVLYDIEQRRRVREYRFDGVSSANGGVSPTGDFFAAINYGRMARLRPVTGYPGADDPGAAIPAPENDGVFRVDIGSGQRKLLVSFSQLRDLLRRRHSRIDEVGFYINHSLVNRSGEYIYFFARARLDGNPMAVNIPCSIRTDGTQLTEHEHIGGHPEWDEGTVVIGAKDDRQVLYDIVKKSLVGQIANPELIPGPGGDVSLSADAKWFVCGYAEGEHRDNKYAIIRRADNLAVLSQAFSRGPYKRGELRIDPAPRWNRDSTAILVPRWTDDGTRQMHLISIRVDDSSGN